MSTKTWNGSNADWTTAADWSPNGVPVSTDTAIINGGTATIGAADAGITVASVTLGGASASLAITDPGQTQTITGNVSNAGSLDVDLTGSGGSTLSIGGTLTNSASGADGVFIGNAGITQSTVVSVGGLSNTGTMTLAGGSAGAEATLTETGTGTDVGKISMNAFADLAVSGALTLEGGTIAGGRLSGGGVIDTGGGGIAGTLTGVTISSGTTFTVTNGTVAEIGGTTTNQGTISLDSSSVNGSQLEIAASGATLTGGGAVTLSNINTNIIEGAVSGAQLTNVNNTIEGSGLIETINLDNQAGGTVDADQSTPLQITTGANTFDNEGLLEATAGGTLQLTTTTITQTQNGGTGLVEASGAGSAVKLSGATIIGGTLTALGGGAIETAGGGIAGILTGVTVSSGTTFTVANGTVAEIGGTTTNQGTISLDSSSVNGSQLEIAASGATLTGDGAVTLSNINTNIIEGAVSGAQLTNVNNTIEGSGLIETINLDNQAGGTVDADQSTPLQITTGANTFDNEGLLEATAGGTLQLTTTTITQTENGGTGLVEASGAGSAVKLSGATIIGGTLTASGGGVIETAGGGIAGILTGVTVSSGTTFTVASQTNLELGGTIVNDGTIALVGAGPGSTTLQVAAGGAALTGGGTINLSNNATNIIEDASGSTGALTNVNDTIQGSGLIETISLDNQAGGTIDADQSTPLQITTGANTFDNEGLLEATAGGTLQLTTTTITQTQNGGTGLVEASGAGSAVKLSGATIIGGTLTASGGGVIETAGGGIAGILTGVTVSSGTTFTVASQTNLELGGTIVNDGTIALVGAGPGSTTLQVAAGGAALTGGGTINLSNNATNIIEDASGSTGALTNVNDTIQGSGFIQSLISFDNQAGGTVNADQPTPLVIQSISGALTNDGTFEAANGGTLHVLSAIGGSGQLLVQASSEIDLGGATGETTTFIGANGTLKLDTPSNYSGTISGFAVGDTLDLGNTNAISAVPTASGSNTTLTVNLSSGSHLTYTLAGDYTADTFTVTHSGNDSFITVSSANAPPVLSGAGNTVGYLQGGPAISVDGALTVSDVADPIITSATAQISGGFVSGDQLNFTSQNGISGLYDAATGILTLSGGASITAYQAALESVTFASTSSDPTNSGADPTRTVTWIAGNGAVNSTPVTSTIDVTALPVLSGAGNSVSYSPGAAGVTTDGGLTVTDFSSPTLTGASVAISAGFLAGDQLNFASQNGIAGSYDAATGVLTLSGAASLVSYQAVLDSVSFSSTSADPTNGGNDLGRTITYVANNGTAGAVPVISTVDVTAPPVLAGAGNNATYIVGGAAVAVDGALTVSDVSSQSLTGATVAIGSGLLAGDALNATNLDGGVISEAYNTTTGVLTLSGAASLAAYQAALDSVTYSSASADPTNAGADPARTVTWTATNGSAVSASVSTTIGFSDLPPVLSGAGNTVGYTQGGTASVIDGALAVADQSSGTLSGATVAISSGFVAGDQLNFTTQGGITGSYGGGVLTLSGSASLAAYQAALDSITYSSSSANPTDFGTDPSRTVSFQVSAGALSSKAVTSTVDVTGVDQPPVLSGAGNTATYTLGLAPQAVDASLAVSDPDNLNLAGATVEITGNLTAGDQLNATNLAGGAISEAYNATTGTLTLGGSASLAAYQAALDSVVFSTTSTGSSARTVSWQVNDGTDGSNTVTSSVDIAVLPPILGGAGNVVTYTPGAAATDIDSGLTVGDVSSSTLTGATVAISSGLLAGDQLNFTNTGGISGSYNMSTGVLTLTGSASLAAYQAALESISFSSTAADPANGGADPTRTISWTASSGAVSSSPVSSTIDVTALPVLAGAGNTVTYTPGGAAATVDRGLTVADPSSATLSGATVAIAAAAGIPTVGFLAGDQLSFTGQSGIGGAYNAATGILTLSGTASLAAYQAMLDSVTYSSTAADPINGGSDTGRTISWTVQSGTAVSASVFSTVDIAILPPVLGGAGNTVTYTQGGAPTALDNGLSVTDPSSGTLTGAAVKISGGLLAGDQLNFTNQNGISGSYNAAVGVLTLSGTASLAAYQAALDSVTYGSTATDPTNGGADASRTISWTAQSGGAVSAPVTSAVNVELPAGPPVLGHAANTVNWVQGGSATPVDNAITVSDTASATLTGARVVISGGFVQGDQLNFTNQNGITGTYTAGTHTLTLSGTASLVAYQQALESVTFSSLATNPTQSGTDSTRTISWTAQSGSQVSAPVTSTVDVGQTYTLTTGNDTIHGGVGNDTIVAPNPNTLNAGDSIDGGGGSNTLVLEGSVPIWFGQTANFNLNSPKQLTDIQTIDMAGAPNAQNSLTLRNGLDNVTVNIGTPSTSAGSNTSFAVHGGSDNAVINVFGSVFTDIVVGSANETVDLNTTGGVDLVAVNSSTIGATINGGTNSKGAALLVSGGGNAAMGSNITNIENVDIQSQRTNFTANSTKGLDVFDASTGRNTLTAGGLGQTLDASLVVSDTLVGYAQGGTTFDVNGFSFFGKDTIGGFSAPNDLIHLLAPDNHVQTSYHQDNANSGTLTVSTQLFPGFRESTQITLLGQFVAAGFQTAADKGGGIDITYHPPSQASALASLATPHA